MSTRTQRSVPSLQGVALAVLLLLLLPQDVQAQQKPAEDTSWMPKVTTRSSARSGLAAAQQAGAGDTEADAAVSPKRPGTTAGPQASKQTADTTAAKRPRDLDAASLLDPEAVPASLPSKAGAAGGGAAVAAGVQRAGAATKPRAKDSKTPARQSSTDLKAKTAAANPPGSLHNVLAKNTPLFRSLLTVLGIRPEDVPPSTVGTFFAPTDDAISEFLSSMGLSASQLAARPELVDLIVSYHFAPGYQVRGAEDVVGSSRVLLTGDEQYTMKIAPAAGEISKLTLSDIQKSSANIVDGPITPDNNSIAVFVIDKVLRSGNYFLNLESALGHSPYWISAKSLAVKSDVLRQLEGRPVTLLVPDNTAFKPLEANLSRASTSRLADVLKYHVLPKVRRLPKGFESGPTDTLLKGHSLEINMTSEMQKDPFSGSKEKNILVPILRISPEVGRMAQVNYYNIFAGPAILHGIDQLLMPDLPQDPDQLPPPPEESPDGGEGGNEDQQPPGEDEQPADGGPGAKLAGPDSVGEWDAEGPQVSNSSAAGRVKPGGLAAVGAGQRSMTPAGAAAAGAGGAGLSGSAAGRLRPATTPPVSVEAGARGLTRPGAATGSAAAAAANGVRSSMPGGPASSRLPGEPAAGSGVGTSAAAAPGSSLRGAGPGAGTGAGVGSGLGSGVAGREAANQEARAAALDAGEPADAAKGPGRRLLQAAAQLWTTSTHIQLADVHAYAWTPRRMLQTARTLLQMTPATRPRAATDVAAGVPTAVPSAKNAAAAAGAGKPRTQTVAGFGALSSAVPVGSVGQLQTFANGIASNKTMIALTRASLPKVPKEYVNRYGALKGPTVKGGCLNCKAWGGQPQ